MAVLTGTASTMGSAAAGPAERVVRCAVAAAGVRPRCGTAHWARGSVGALAAGALVPRRQGSSVQYLAGV